jgi:hypothetical protein
MLMDAQNIKKKKKKFKWSIPLSGVILKAMLYVYMNIYEI